jgi:hypothetical protein
VRAELDAGRGEGPKLAQAAEAEQKQALNQERDRADALARDVTSLRAELDAARAEGPKAAQAADAAQKHALKQERDRADALARDVTSLRAELDAARAEAPKAAQAAEAEQKRAEALARELTSVRAELDAARAAGPEAARTAEATKVAQEVAFADERHKTETLARELASARKETEARSALLAATHAEVLQAMETNKTLAAEQKLALASERDRADALTRELTSVRNELEAANGQIAALTALRALNSRPSVVAISREWMAESSSRTIKRDGRSPQQTSGARMASPSGRSSISELPSPEPQSAAREATSGSKTATATTERSGSASGAPRSPVDEQRLLARANTLLLQADISGARPLLEHALERGSARAAFMLAETYDARVLQSWGARGISGDLAKARELYEWAKAGGIGDAKERIEALK